ncbi:hypothetical protein D3C87_81350 [compost metagenome]
MIENDEKFKDIIDNFEYFVCGLQLISNKGLSISSKSNNMTVSYKKSILSVKFFNDKLLYSVDEACCSVTVIVIDKPQINFNAKLNKNFNIDISHGKTYCQYVFDKILTGSDLYNIMRVAFDEVEI